MINQIQEDTGADISIEDDGTVYIGATDGPSAEAARAAINAIANPTMPEVGERFLGTVVKTTTFGAFVSLLPGKDGLLHISEVRKLVGGKRIDSVDDVLKIGQKVQVELKEIDPRGKLSLAAVLAEGEGADGSGGAAPVTRAETEADPAPAAAHESRDGEAHSEGHGESRHEGHGESRHEGHGESRHEGRGERSRGRNRRRGRRGGDEGAQTGTDTPEADALVEAHGDEQLAPATSEDA